MFQWLTSLFRSPDRFDIFDPGEQLIYQYHDGQKWIKADPMVLYKRILEKKAELAIGMKTADSVLIKPEVSLKAHGDVIEIIRWVFGIKPYADGGLTEPNVRELLDHFLIFSERLKKKSSPPAISAMATSVTTDSSPVAAAPTPNTTDSGSTGSVSFTVEPDPSPSAPESPLETTQDESTGTQSATAPKKPPCTKPPSESNPKTETAEVTT